MLKSSQAVVERANRPMRQFVRQWCVAAAAISLFYSALAPAVGLGDITLHSALEQPFDADIELVETAGLSADDIHVTLASPEAFARAGIDRLFFFNDLRFTPIIHGNRGVVHVVSKKPVSEPYLNFMVRLARPNGDVLHAYTVLIDPPDSAIGGAASRSRRTEPAAQNTIESRMPVAPPQAVQGNRYTVASGDNLGSIARRLQGPGSKVSASELASGIQALNPQAFPSGNSTRLKVGQSLLLPDAAVLPRSAVTPAAPAANQATPAIPVAPSEVQQNAEQLTATVIENQLLSKTVDDLKGQMQGLQEQVSGKDKQVVELQTALAELKSSVSKVAPAAPAPVAAPVAVAATPIPAAPEDDSSGNMMLLLGAVLVLLLLLGLAYSVRRNKLKQALPVQDVGDMPVPEPVVSMKSRVVEKPVVVATPEPAPQAPVVATPPATNQRLAGAATDALDGASIYIAYGRFSEALGILRDASAKQPERTDLRLRILELLAQQGDADGFAREEQVLLDQGFSVDKLQEIRTRHPQLQETPTPEPLPLLPVAASEPESTPEPESVNLEPHFDEPQVSASNPQPADEFHLNLEDLSMDADWDLVDPFETTPAPRNKNQPQQPVEPESDPDFASNLKELPEVFEMPDEQFLSDFAEPDVIVQSNSDSLDDEFLNGFMDDSADFDLLDLTDEPLSKINQAQVLIDEGDLDNARELLQEVINEGDDDHQRTARDLLAGIS